MEIRNALKKIDNYLSAVQVLNKTILEEGTMAPEELRLMKKYLRGCIERIEEIESKLHIADTEEQEMIEETPATGTVPEQADVSLAPDTDTTVFAEATPVSEPEWDLTLASEQIIIDPEQTRTVSEAVTETEPTALFEEPAPAWEEPVVSVEVTAAVAEPELPLVRNEEPAIPVVESPARSWADLWAEEQEPAVNNLVAAQDAVEEIPFAAAVEVVQVTVTETETETVAETTAAPLVAAEEAEEVPVVETIVALKTETTLNDIIQSRQETGLFERFAAPRPEPVATSATTAVLSEIKAEAADTDVLLAEPEPERPELSLSHILSKVRTTGEERSRSAKTLSESIALNDKFIFVRELFANQFNEYENALRTLDQLNSLGEAQQFCRQHLEERFRWNERPANAEKFYAILEKRFSA